MHGGPGRPPRRQSPLLVDVADHDAHHAVHYDDTSEALRHLVDVFGFEAVVTASDDVVEPPHETRFGSGVTSYVFTARDHEGNLWTFGTYDGPASSGTS